MGDPVDDVGHHAEVQLCNFSSHRIDRVDGTDHDRPVIGAQTVGDAGRLEIRDDGEILPDLAFKTVGLELFPKNRIGFADRFQRRHSARQGPAPGTADDRPCYPAGQAACRRHGPRPYIGT